MEVGLAPDGFIFLAFMEILQGKKCCSVFTSFWSYVYPSVFGHLKYDISETLNSAPL